MVAFKPVDRRPGVGERCNGREEAHESAWHHGAVFIPVVDGVAEDVERGGFAGKRSDPFGNGEFVGAVVGDPLRSQMQVGYEVGFFLIHVVRGVMVRIT